MRRKREEDGGGGGGRGGLASPNDQKYSRYSLVLNFNITLVWLMRLVILHFVLSDDPHLYLYDSR